MRLTNRASALAAASLALALLACINADVTADDVTTTAGKKLNGKLTGVDAQGITFTTAGAGVQISARDIVVVDLGHPVVAPPKDATYSEIELTDGSIFRVAKFALKGKNFEVDHLPPPAGQTVPTYTLPMSSVFSAMKRADEPKQRDHWKKMLSTRGKRDLYVIQQETGLTYVQGTIQEGSADGKTIKFESENGGKADEKLLSRCAGLVFYQPQPASVPPTLCRVIDVYGNSLNAANIAISADGVVVTTVAGASVKYASTASLSKLDYALGNVAYLSDLQPQVETPDLPAEEKKLNPSVAWLKDRSLANDGIKLDNQPYPKGICIAPDTVLTYALGGDYAQFKAMVGIDENGTNATSAAKVTIEADGQILFTDVVRRKDKPKGVVLTVKGVKSLRVIVEADTPLNGNYVILADARVQK